MTMIGNEAIAAEVGKVVVPKPERDFAELYNQVINSIVTTLVTRSFSPFTRYLLELRTLTLKSIIKSKMLIQYYFFRYRSENLYIKCPFETLTILYLNNFVSTNRV